MQKNKNYIKINPGEDVELYRLFKRLEKYGRVAFSYPNNPRKQRGMARSIGIRGKPLIDKGLLHPPTVTHNRYPSTNIIALPVDVKIVERKGKNNSYFDFQKIYHTL